MGRLLDNIREFFVADEWPHEQHGDRPILRTSFAGDNGSWMGIAQEREEEEQLIFYSLAPVRCPEDKRALMAEFITRANYGMVIGNFEMDFSDGEIRFKTSADLEGDFAYSQLIQI